MHSRLDRAFEWQTNLPSSPSSLLSSFMMLGMPPRLSGSLFFSSIISRFYLYIFFLALYYEKKLIHKSRENNTINAASEIINISCFTHVAFFPHPFLLMFF